MDQQTAFIISQIISVVTGILAVVMMQLKSMKGVLIFEIIVNATTLSSYFLVGGDTGAFICVLAMVQSVVMYLYKRKSKEPQLWVIILFIIGYLGLSVYNIVQSKQIIDILPACAAICFCLALVQKKTAAFRIWGALNPLFWLGYDIYTKSYVLFCVHFGILVSSIVGMIRLDGALRRKRS